MADKIVVTPDMVAQAYVDGTARNVNLVATSEWAKRVADGLTKALNPGPWVANGPTVQRGLSDDPDFGHMRISVVTSYGEHGMDTEARTRMARGLADLLNEADFKREDYA